ncbi:hypothetical protein MRX96_046098 [Rhipicephalus microplus]
MLNAISEVRVALCLDAHSGSRYEAGRINDDKGTGDDHNIFFNSSSDDDAFDHTHAHHANHFFGSAIYCPLHNQHGYTYTRSSQPGGHEHHDSSAAYHNVQAKQRQHGCGVLSGNAGLRALPRLRVVPRSEEGARPCGGQNWVKDTQALNGKGSH